MLEDSLFYSLRGLNFQFRVDNLQPICSYYRNFVLDDFNTNLVAVMNTACCYAYTISVLKLYASLQPWYGYHIECKGE